MSLSAGSRLGPYEVLAPLGAGGMGVVYRARDTKLNRDVALKILPDGFSRDPDRLARFTREAQTLASLNHPLIAGVYGLEEANGIRALAMELVEGEDLAQRIARGPIPIEDALAIARQVAEAVEAAHEGGVVHRDLKPANIKVRPDGTVKVLDFGLAKALDARSGGRDAGAAQPTNSPTITSPAALTSAAGDGLDLGTPTVLFEGRFVTVTNPSGDRWYDVTPDGQRFLMLKADDNHHLIRVQNWSEELKTLVPVKR